MAPHLPGTGSDWLAFGILRRPHGTKGEIFLLPYNGCGTRLKHSALPTRVRLAHAASRDVDVAGYRPVREGYLVRFEGIADRESVAALVGQELYFPRSCFAPLAAAEFYVEDIVGYKVSRSDGQKLGRVSGTFWNGAQDVMTIAGEDGVERLLPVVEEYVRVLDHEHRSLVVDPHD
jgi:16S rRNA processing protein RimM